MCIQPRSCDTCASKLGYRNCRTSTCNNQLRNSFWNWLGLSPHITCNIAESLCCLQSHLHCSKAHVLPCTAWQATVCGSNIIAAVMCMSQADASLCTAQCGAQLECGHKCNQRCGACLRNTTKASPGEQHAVKMLCPRDAAPCLCGPCSRYC